MRSVASPHGKIFVVGLGPGSTEHLTGRARKALLQSDVIIGYARYLGWIQELTQAKKVIASPVSKVAERAQTAIEEALGGQTVAVVSSGDPGVYGMAGPLVEALLKRSGLRIELEIVPGVTALTAAAALLGAPLSKDFACVSLSDLHTSWDLISKRVAAACEADFVIVLYNPKSKRRTAQLRKACQIILKSRGARTPVGIVRNAFRDGQSVCLSTLGRLVAQKVDMDTVIIVGNSRSRLTSRFMVTV